MLFWMLILKAAVGVTKELSLSEPMSSSGPDDDDDDGVLCVVLMLDANNINLQSCLTQFLPYFFLSSPIMVKPFLSTTIIVVAEFFGNFHVMAVFRLSSFV